MEKEKAKRVTYKIEIPCEVNSYGAVIPLGASKCIEDEQGNLLDMLKYPDATDIMDIWIGKDKQYPTIKP